MADLQIAEFDASPEATLARIEAAFAPGPLAAKRDELAALRDRGDTMLFDGAVDWALILTNSDRHMSGYATSLDEAFEDIIACLDHMAADEGADSEVVCAVSQASDGEDDSDDDDSAKGMPA